MNPSWLIRVHDDILITVRSVFYPTVLITLNTDLLHTATLISRSFCLSKKDFLAHSLFLSVIDEEMQDQATSSIAASSLPSSSERSSSSALQLEVKEGVLLFFFLIFLFVLFIES